MSWLHREININQRIAQINAHNLLLLNHLTRLGEITSLWKDFTSVWKNVWGLIEHLEKIWTCISNFFAFGDTFIVLIGQILKKINYPSCHQRKPLYHIRVWWIPRWLIRLLRRRLALLLHRLFGDDRHRLYLRHREFLRWPQSHGQLQSGCLVESSFQRHLPDRRTLQHLRKLARFLQYYFCYFGNRKQK